MLFDSWHVDGSSLFLRFDGGKYGRRVPESLYVYAYSSDSERRAALGRRHIPPDDLKDAFSDALLAWPCPDRRREGYRNPGLIPFTYKVPYAEGAEEAAARVWRWQASIIEADEGQAGIVGRAYEQTLKFAMIRAVSRDFAAPAITVDDIAFGEAIAMTSIRMMRAALKTYLHGSDFEAACKAMLRHVRAAGAEGLTEIKLKRRSGVSKLKPKEFGEASRHLSNMGDWRPVESNRGVRYFSI